MVKFLHKKPIFVLSGALLVGTLCGFCGYMTQTSYKLSSASAHNRAVCNSGVFKYTFGNLDGDTMPIMGYAGPCDSKIAGTSSTHDVPMNANTLEEYKAVKASGINTIIPLSDNTSNDGGYELFEALDNAEKAGINYFVHDPKFGDKVHDKQTLLAELAKYSSYKSFAGIFQADEPPMSKFETFKTAGSLMREYAPELCYYVNLFPMFAYYGALTGNTSDPSNPLEHKQNWLKYINAFYDTYQPLYLSYDNYPYTNADPEIDHDWFGNLNICNKWCQEKGIPFFTFNLASAHLNYRQPTHAEFNWQVNTNLVYGAKGIQYFCYQTPNSFTQDHADASFIDKHGRVTGTYAMGAELHAQIRSMDHVLMNSSHQQIIQINNIPEYANGSRSPGYSWVDDDYGTTKDQNWRELTSVTSSGDFLIGCFDYKGASVFYIVNDQFAASKPASQSITLNFNTYVEGNAYALNGNSIQKGNSITFNVGKGEAVCFEITNYDN